MEAIFQHIHDSFAHHIIFSAGLLLIIGYLMGQLSERLKLPAITGYIFAGILLGESGTHLIRRENLEILNILSEITLSFIAVIIGGEFSFYKLKLYGRNVIILTLAQMFLTFLLVSGGLVLLGLSSYVALLLGAIAAATAPAATVVIVEKLKAKGPFVDYLYGIVALDDAGTVILFSVAYAIASSFMGEGTVHLLHSVLHAFEEIGFSLLIGVVMGLLIHYTATRKRNMNEVKILALGYIFLSTALAISLNLSPLIANMTTGMLLINLSRKNLRILTALQPLTPPLYAIFFAIAGTELKLSIFANPSFFFIGMSFILLRACGKYFGVYFGSRALKLEPKIRNYLGLSLLPQAGVAIGLVLFIQGSPLVRNASPHVLTEIREMINIVLMSVFVNEIAGPPLATIAIKKNLKRRI